MRHVVHIDRCADDIRNAAVAALPQTMTQDDHAGAVRDVLAGRDEASQCRAHTERLQEAARHESHVDILWGGRVVGQRGRSIPDTADRAECGGVVTERDQLRPGTGWPPALLARQLGVDDTQAIRFRVRQRSQQDAVDDREDGDVGANAQRQGRHDDEGKGRSSGPDPHGYPQVRP
jgi:hypothetical protein